MATNQNSIVFKMAYAPVDHLFEGGRRLALVLTLWWTLAVLVLYVVSALLGFWDLEVSLRTALWLTLAGVTGIRLMSASIGYVTRGFLGIRNED